MGRTKTEKGRVIDDTFRREAVRILASGGRTIKAVADDLGIGVSSLGAWKRKLDRADLMAGPRCLSLSCWKKADLSFYE